MGGILYNVWLHGLCAEMSLFLTEPRYSGTQGTISISSNSEGSKKLPDYGNLLPKHVGASI
jgi:hypothetical protein